MNPSNFCPVFKLFSEKESMGCSVNSLSKLEMSMSFLTTGIKGGLTYLFSRAFQFKL